MSEVLFRDGGLIVISLVSAYLVFTKSNWLVGWMAIVCPMAYFTTYVGFQLTPAKVLGLILIFRYSIMANEEEKILVTGFSLRRYKAFFVYVFFVTLALCWIWPNTSANNGFLYGTGRVLNTLMTLIMGIAIMITFYLETRTDRGLRLFIQCTFWMIVGVSIHGIYQWIGQKYGLPVIGMSRAFGAQGVAGSIDFQGERMARAFSVVGEPKGLASTISVGILLLIFVNSKAFLGNLRILKIPALALMITAFVLTFSTAGFLILPLGFVACFAVLLLARRLDLASLAIVGLAIPFALPIGFGYLFESTDDVQSYVQARTVDRLEESGILTPIDQAVFQFWNDEPLFAVIGCGRGGHSFFIREYTDAYPGFVIYARGALGLTADYGIIGMFLLFSAFIGMLIAFTKFSRMHPNNLLYSAALLVVVQMMVRSMTSSQYFTIWATMGVAAALHLRTIIQTEEPGLIE